MKIIFQTNICILVFLYWKTDICNIKLSRKFLSFYKGIVRCTAFLVLYYFIESILSKNNENIVHQLFPYKAKETVETAWYLHARKNRENNINRIWFSNTSKFPIAILRYYYSKRSKILNQKNETFALARPFECIEQRFSQNSSHLWQVNHVSGENNGERQREKPWRARKLPLRVSRIPLIVRDVRSLYEVTGTHTKVHR